MTALCVAGWAAAAVATAAVAVLAARHRARLELVARADHELRGPLTAARIALEAIEGDGDSAGAVAALDFELCRAALAVADLTEARLGRRARGREEVVDACAIASSALAAAAAFGARAAVRTPNRPVPVRADPLRLAQAVANLVANAAEHGGGRVAVLVRCDAGRCRIEVRDDGPGLPAPVAVLAGRAAAGRGVRGRGLAIAAAAAADCGGRLVAAPSARGARLVVELPVVGHLALGCATGAQAAQ